MQQTPYTPNLAVYKLWKDKPLAPLTDLTTFEDDPRILAVVIVGSTVSAYAKMMPNESRLSKIDENEPGSSRTFNWFMIEFPQDIECELPGIMDGDVGGDVAYDFPFKAELLKRSENPVLPFDLNPEDWIIR